MKIIFQSLISGIKKVLCNWKIFLFYYLFLLLISSLLILPLLVAIIKEISHSWIAVDLLQKNNPTSFIEFLINNPSYLSILFPLVIFLSVIFLFYAIFTSGGALKIYSENKNSLKDFFYWASEFFPAILRGFLLVLPFYLLSMLLVSAIFQFRWRFLYERGLEKIYFITELLAILILIFLLNFSSMIFDYLRIDLIVNKHKKARNALLNAILFIFGNIKKTLLLFYSVSIIQLISLILLFGIERMIQFNKLDYIFITLITQLCIIVRIIGKLTKMSSEESLYIALEKDLIKEG